MSSLIPISLNHIRPRIVRLYATLATCATAATHQKSAKNATLQRWCNGAVLRLMLWFLMTLWRCNACNAIFCPYMHTHTAVRTECRSVATVATVALLSFSLNFLRKIESYLFASLQRKAQRICNADGIAWVSGIFELNIGVLFA